MIRKLLILLSVLTGMQAFAQNAEQEKAWMAMINKGKQEYAVENWLSAMQSFIAAQKSAPFDTLAYNYIIDCAYKSKRYKTLSEYFSKLRTLRGDRFEHWVMAIQSARDFERNYNATSELIKEAKTKYGKNNILTFEEIALMYKKREFTATAAKLDTFLTIDPKNRKAINLLIKIRIEALEQYDAALKLIRTAQNYFPDSLSYKMQEADVYLRKKSFDAAQAKFEELIKLNPSDPKLYYNLALLHYEKNDYEKSADICLKAIELAPDYLDAIYNVGTFYYNMAVSYCQGLGDMTLEQYNDQGSDFEKNALHYFEKAKPYFEKAILLNPNELDAFENINTINLLSENIKQNIAETEERLKADSITRSTAKINLIESEKKLNIDSLPVNQNAKIIALNEQNIPTPIDSSSVANNILPVLKKDTATQNNTPQITETIKNNETKQEADSIKITKLKSTIVYDYSRISILSDKPYLELGNLRFFYPDTAGSTLKRGQTGYIRFNVGNRGEVKAQNLKAMLLQPYVSPDLRFPPHLKIDNINPGEVINISIPIHYQQNSVNIKGIENIELPVKKMRLFIKEPQNYNSELKEFTFNIGQNSQKATASTGLTSKNYLILIAADKYNHFDNVPGAVQKAENLKNILTSKYQFSEEDIYELYNYRFTVENLRNELIKIKKDLTPNDNLIIYFAGQSYNDTVTDNQFWLPFNADKNNLKESLSGQTLISYLKGLNLKHICILSDAQFTDAFLMPEGSSDFQPDNDALRSRWLLSADKNKFDPSSGVLTKYLLQALNENTNSKIAISEIVNFVKLISKDKDKQLITGGALSIPGNESGEFIFYKKK